jgi:HTH-type transcriptional regulator / antitoxin HipB
MLLRTPKDIGALIRQRRRESKIDQKTLAQRVGVGRKWIVEVEAGKPGKELQLVLRTLDVLGVRLTTDEPKKSRPPPAPPVPDIDAVVSAARKRYGR